MDMRRAVNDIWGDVNFVGYTDTGMPIEERYKGKRPLKKAGKVVDYDLSPVPVGRGRKRNNKKDRKGNGIKEWNGKTGDSWAQPDVIGKSSRIYQKLLKEALAETDWEEDSE